MASEIGGAQTEGRNTFGVRTAKGTDVDSRTVLEKQIREGENPVGEIYRRPAVSGVRRDTRNPDGRHGDHPIRLNTTM